MKNIFFLGVASILSLFSCKSNYRATTFEKNKAINANETVHNSNATALLPDTTFVNLKDYSSDFIFDMKYATTDNFLKSKVYDCEACYLRYETVKALLVANSKFMKKGYRIKIFDCYRPVSIQKKMWKIVPNPRYVANPAKGSIHNRGGAVDITLVAYDGTEVPMGTPFDFFGIEASHSYSLLGGDIKSNRKLLKKIMQQSNFKSLDSEWWHYNFSGAESKTISDFKWTCD